MSKQKLRCPYCNHVLSISLFTGFLGAKGGKASGAAKARTREQAQKAAAARWAKHKVTTKKESS